jgi:hypothetical protein
MLSESQTLKVLIYLGLPMQPQAKQNVALAAADAFAVAGQSWLAQIASILNELDRIQDQLNQSRLGAGQSFRSGQGGTSQFFRGDRLAELRQAGRQQVQYLSQLLGLPHQSDVFSDNPGTTGSFGGRVTRA